LRPAAFRIAAFTSCVVRRNSSNFLYKWLCVRQALTSASIAKGGPRQPAVLLGGTPQLAPASRSYGSGEKAPRRLRESVDLLARLTESPPAKP